MAATRCVVIAVIKGASVPFLAAAVQRQTAAAVVDECAEPARAVAVTVEIQKTQPATSAHLKRNCTIKGKDPELNRGCAPSPPARLQRVDKCCHQQSRRI